MYPTGACDLGRSSGSTYKDIHITGNANIGTDANITGNAYVTNGVTADTLTATDSVSAVSVIATGNVSCLDLVNTGNTFTTNTVNGANVVATTGYIRATAGDITAVAGNITATAGQMAYNLQHMEMTVVDNTATTTGWSGTDWQVVVVNNASATMATGFTVSTTGLVTYTGAPSIMFHIGATITINPLTTNNSVYEFAVFKNGLNVLGSHVILSTVTINNAQSTAIHKMIGLETGDTMQLYTRRISGTSDYTATDINFFAMGMSTVWTPQTLALVLPAMTSETTPSPLTASFSNQITSNHPAYFAFNHKTGTSPPLSVFEYSGWHTNNTSNIATTIVGIGPYGRAWLQIDTGVATTVSHFKLWCSIEYPNRNPVRFYIVGSNDGATWNIVHDQTAANLTYTTTGTTVANGYMESPVTEFSAGSATYRYYRLCIATPGVGEYIMIQEFELWN